jgi:hypothetical protein
MLLEKRFKEMMKQALPALSFDQEELKEYLLMALDEFNSAPPATSLTLKELISKKPEYVDLIMTRAAAFACFSLELALIPARSGLLAEYETGIKEKKDFCLLSSGSVN